MIPRLRQVQIRNYRSIGRVVVDLEPFTVLVGANGSGKSNFLDSLAFVRDCLLGSPAAAAGKASLTPRWESSAVRTGFRLQFELGERHTADYAFEVSFAEDGRVTRELCRVEQAGQEYAFEVDAGEFRIGIPGVRARIHPDRLVLPLASATQEFRPVYDFLTDIGLYSIDPATVADAESAEWLELIQKQPYLMERIDSMLAMAVPGFRHVYTRRQGDQLVSEFHHDAAGIEQRFSAKEMSKGTLHLLGLLLAIYQPKRPSVLAIEEPDAWIHPGMAEVVFEALLDAAHNRQVLITTHSPDILDVKELSDEQIRVVTMEDGRTTIAPLSQASRQAIREHLYTPGELLRSNELNQDAQAAAEAAEKLDLFAATASTQG